NFNYAQYIDQSIQSVLAQTYDHFELIICDDGSTDGSLRVIEPYAQRDPRVRLLAKVHGGQASALNEAFRHCQGDIICLLDSDDCYAPLKLEKLVQHYQAQTAAGMSVHALNVVDSDGGTIQRIPYLTAFERGWICQRVVR